MSVFQTLKNNTSEQLQRILEDMHPYIGWQAVGIVACGYVAYKVLKLLKMWLLDPQLSPLLNLPGPESYGSIIWGNMAEIFESPPLVVHERWFNKYGHTITYRGLFMAPQLSTKDPKALAHILNHCYDYPKAPRTRSMLSRVLGNGLLIAEGGDHRRQRKVMNPCFGPGQIRDLMPIFYDKAFELRDIWIRQIIEGGPHVQEIDASVWFARTTLDIIGLAGFGYELDTLANGEKNELVRAFIDLFSPDQTGSVIGYLANWIPMLRWIPTTRERTIARSRAVMNRIGMALVRDKRAAILAASDGAGVEKKTVKGRDVLSVLIKANMATDVKESERMSDEEVIGQICTMLIAGHETTATSLTWLLYDLSLPQHQHIQTKLRDELLTLTSECPTTEELNNLPYLDAVVRENLRYRSVVDTTMRCAGKDDVIPVSTPYKDRNGIERTEIRIAVGELILIPIGSLDRDKAVWGEDANEFRPERWLGRNDHPRSEIPGVFSGVLTFLGGPRACIGHRFAVMEMKVLIFTLIRGLSFELPENTPLIEKISRIDIVTRPTIRQPDGTFKTSMPLRANIARSD